MQMERVGKFLISVCALSGLLAVSALAAPLSIDKLYLGQPTSKADILYGHPKYFDTDGFQQTHHAVRCFYGANRGFPAIEWDANYNVTRIAGLSFQRGDVKICTGASRTAVRKMLGQPDKIRDTIEIYREAQSELQIYYDASGQVKMFNLLSL